jgi:hypothetical protein
MAEESNSAGNTLLAVIIGGILVVMVAFFAFGGFNGMQDQANGGDLTIIEDNPDVTVELPDVNVSPAPPAAQPAQN